MFRWLARAKHRRTSIKLVNQYIKMDGLSGHEKKIKHVENIVYLVSGSKDYLTSFLEVRNSRLALQRDLDCLTRGLESGIDQAAFFVSKESFLNIRLEQYMERLDALEDVLLDMVDYE